MSFCTSIRAHFDGFGTKEVQCYMMRVLEDPFALTQPSRSECCPRSPEISLRKPTTSDGSFSDAVLREEAASRQRNVTTDAGRQPLLAAALPGTPQRNNCGRRRPVSTLVSPLRSSSVRKTTPAGESSPRRRWRRTASSAARCRAVRRRGGGAVAPGPRPQPRWRCRPPLEDSPAPPRPTQTQSASLESRQAPSPRHRRERAKWPARRLLHHAAGLGDRLLRRRSQRRVRRRHRCLCAGACRGLRSPHRCRQVVRWRLLKGGARRVHCRGVLLKKESTGLNTTDQRYCCVRMHTFERRLSPPPPAEMHKNASQRQSEQKTTVQRKKPSAKQLLPLCGGAKHRMARSQTRHTLPCSPTQAGRPSSVLRVLHPREHGVLSLLELPAEVRGVL